MISKTRTTATVLVAGGLLSIATLAACTQPASGGAHDDRDLDDADVAPAPVKEGDGKTRGGTCPPPPKAAVDPRAQCARWESAGAPFPLRGRLAVTYAVDPKDPEDHEIGVLDLGAGGPIKRLTNNSVNEAEIDVSPDGRKIVYTVRPELDAFGDSFEIHEIGIDGTGETTLVPLDPKYPYGGGPVWLWPGDGVLFARNRVGSPVELLTYAPASPTPKPLPMEGGPDQATLAELLGPYSEFGDMEVSYDGTMIVFKGSLSTDRDEQPSIYVFNLETRRLKRLTECWSDHDPVFSRDGKKVYFERYYGPGQWFIDDETTTVDEDGNEVDEDGTPIGPWRYQWGIVEVDIETLEERVIVEPDPCGHMLPWLPTVSPSADGRYLMYTVNDLTAWGDDGIPTRPTGEVWVTDLKSPTLQRQKVPGTDWVHFIDWTE